MDRVCVFVCVLLCVVGQAWAYGEADVNGRPVWQERANHVLVNAVRLSPSGYKSLYMSGWNTSNVFATTTYPATAPLYSSVQLDTSSFNHSLDMATTNTFAHTSSDGTDPFVRIGYFYTCGGYEGENIAAGYASPLDTNNQWLCDGSTTSCAVDGNGDGHRSNIMSVNYKAIGVGFDARSGSTYTNYWTQDFGGGVCSPSITSPIYSGSHIFLSSNIKFIVTFYLSSSTAAAPTSAQVFINEVAYDLTFEFGKSASQGQYVLQQAAASACRNYYFVFVSGGVTYRYPETGYLVTYKEGSCVTSFTAASTGSTAAPTTAAPTTAAPTTAAPTTATPTTAAPTTAAPTTAAPTTAAPTTAAPTTATPTTPTPTTLTPTTPTPTTPTPTTPTPTTPTPTTPTPTTPTPTTPTPTTPTPTTPTPTTPTPTTTTQKPWTTTPTASSSTSTTTARPTTTASPVTTTTTSSGNFQNDVINGHNAARTAVHQKGLTWNTTIAAFAANYAKNCVFQHNSNLNGYGENIYASSGAVASTTGAQAVSSWVGEKQYYTCSTNTCASGQTCGHYTQVIWAATSQVGCAEQTCTTNSPFGSKFPTWTFVVCDYNPPGNYVGQSPVPASSC